MQTRRVCVTLCSVVSLASVAGCNLIESQPSSPPNRGRYQIMKDTQGRTVRLDTATGESAVIDDPAPTSSASAASAPAPNPCTPAVASGIRQFVAATPIDVFARADRSEASIATLPNGAGASVAAVEGEWFVVRFSDPTAGARTGYVHCSSVPRSPAAPRP